MVCVGAVGGLQELLTGCSAGVLCRALLGILLGALLFLPQQPHLQAAHASTQHSSPIPMWLHEMLLTVCMLNACCMA
jgi:hypothetical protein